MSDPASSPQDLSSFTLALPERAGRFVFASPHSGDVYPHDMNAVGHLSQASLRSAEDRLVERLIAPAVDHGAAVLCATVARSYLDLNRGPDEMDPALVESLAPGTGGPRAAAGYGVVPRLTGDGRPLYDRTLSATEVEARLAAVHTPYHSALTERMQAAHAAHGEAILIDWHSMPARAVGGSKGPQVVLGDRHGTACRPALTRRLTGLFEAQGLRVAHNHPYAGGWTTQVWGRPDEGYHAIQIELNRALYWDEAHARPAPGWARCEAAVAAVIIGLLSGR